MIDQSMEYESPLCTAVAFEAEGLLCDSMDTDADDMEYGGGWDFTDEFNN